MTFTRRDLGKIALAALPVGKLLAKPNSKFGGVQIGIIISPTTFRDMPLAADELLKNLVELGISAVEMQDVRVEAYAGAPIVRRAAAPAGGRGQGGRGQAPLTPEQQEARRKAVQELKAWRISASMDKYKALRQMYRDSGVSMYAFRMASLTSDISDEELAYYFNATQALGANQITVELPTDTALTQRVGDYAGDCPVIRRK
jgi:hypothetical protein